MWANVKSSLRDDSCIKQNYTITLIIIIDWPLNLVQCACTMYTNGLNTIAQVDLQQVVGTIYNC